MVLCVCVMATNFLELAITLKYLGAKWLPGKKGNFTPCTSKFILMADSVQWLSQSDYSICIRILEDFY